ncbi:hypothetical protein ES703_78888 [subsurface metagenome]
MAICDDYLTDIYSAYDESKFWLEAADPYISWLKNNYQVAGFYLAWKEAVTFSIARLHSAVEYLTYCNNMQETPLRIPYYLEHCVGGKVDMSAILTAMGEAEPHQPLLFMAYVQAYEASVWNATFDERFFADLVKKWSIWG